MNRYQKRFRINSLHITAMMLIFSLGVSCSYILTSDGLTSLGHTEYTFIGKVGFVDQLNSSSIEMYQCEIEVVKILDHKNGDPRSIEGETVIGIWYARNSGEKIEKGDRIKGILNPSGTFYQMEEIEVLSDWEFYNEIYHINIILIAIPLSLGFLLIILFSVYYTIKWKQVKKNRSS